MRARTRPICSEVPRTGDLPERTGRVRIAEAGSSGDRGRGAALFGELVQSAGEDVVAADPWTLRKSASSRGPRFPASGSTIGRRIKS